MLSIGNKISFRLLTSLGSDFYFVDSSLAYSLQDLGGGGNVIRARRSSDNAQQDFTAADITGGSLASWSGGGDVFVAIWYDQSGSGRNATQTTQSQQPQIVSSGSIITDTNGYAAMSFNGASSQYFNVEYLSLYKNRSQAYFAAIAELSNTSSEGLHSATTALGNARFVLRSNSGNWNIGGRREDSDTFVNSNTVSADTNSHIHSAKLDFIGGSFEHYVDGSSAGTVSLANAQKINANVIGGDHAGATSFATYTNTTNKASGSGESFRLHMDYVNPSSRSSGQVYDLFGHSAGTGTGKAWLRTEGTGEDLFTFIGGSKRTLANNVMTNDTAMNLILDYDKLEGELSLFIDGKLITSQSLTPQTANGNFQILRGHTGTTTVDDGFVSNVDYIYGDQSDIDLIVICGQSNAEGQTNSLAPSDYIDDQYHRYAYTVQNSLSETDTNLKPRGGVWGSELSMGQYIFENSNDKGRGNKRKIAVLKVTKGSTTLSNHWNASGAGGTMYNEFKTRYEAFKTSLEAKGYNINLKQFIWIHGESDSNTESSANNYLTNFDAMVAGWNTDLTGGFAPSSTIVTHPPLKDGSERTYQSIVEGHLDTIAARTNNAIIPTDDLAIRTDDKTHYTSESLITLGQRLGDNYLNGTYFSNGNAGQASALTRTSLFTLPCQESDGSTLYNVANDETGLPSATIIGTPIRTTKDGVHNWNYIYGFTQVGSVKVPALSDGSTDAQGNAIGTPSETSESSDTDSTDIYIGRFGSSVFYNGSISEFIAYETDQSTNQTEIESNIAGRYGITLS